MSKRDEFLREQKILHLATVDKKCAPHIVPVWYLFSSKMITVEPEGIVKNTTTHDTLGKDKISFDEVYNQSIQILN